MAFDVAFSHEVLYVLHDLDAHARAIHRSLRPGGVYFAVMGVHTRSPLMVEWHSANAERLGLPPVYDIDDVITTFLDNGFEASLARLAIGFVPITGLEHHRQGRAVDWLTYYSDEKLLLRLTCVKDPNSGELKMSARSTAFSGLRKSTGNKHGSHGKGSGYEGTGR